MFFETDGRPKFKHNGLDVDLEFFRESAGTQRLLIVFMQLIMLLLLVDYAFWTNLIHSFTLVFF